MLRTIVLTQLKFYIDRVWLLNERTKDLSYLAIRKPIDDFLVILVKILNMPYVLPLLFYATYSMCNSTLSFIYITAIWICWNNAT